MQKKKKISKRPHTFRPQKIAAPSIFLAMKMDQTMDMKTQFLLDFFKGPLTIVKKI